ncbi:putative intracellular protease/amidase [Nocardia transvalensis]|uniref:Putative intracellular protease/amidase n=1 Tax=Nocardia transvalensis TaxID=37333 RepID=A0A7W9UKL7_9NOCA|nr:type 1 glutamine amidotransferase domain-containing protein [Nocardia transvalensis]MBB5916624.1 putative intracellular protease/amidase [Nocardia transvalensis]
MTTIAYLVSSAGTITMADGSTHPTGYFAEEALKPYKAFRAAGFDVTVVTPDGNAPTADPYGLQWFFHYPEEDKDYLSSVVRTFAHDVDDIRFTLHHNTELGLAAARRIALLLEAEGYSFADAHELVSKAAKVAWRQDRRLADVMVEDGIDGGLTSAAIHQATADQRAASESLARERKSELEAIEGFNHPVDLRSLSEDAMATFDAVFAPGGHGPMVDLAGNPDVGRLLVALHSKAAPIASLCHGPALMLSAPERADGQWLFDGYRMTCFTDEEEVQTEPGRLGLPWFVDTALKNAGAVFDDGPAAWVSHVVVDRHVITGQNPGSTEAVAAAVVTALHKRSVREAA